MPVVRDAGKLAMGDVRIADLVRTDHATLAPGDPVRTAAARLAGSALSAAPVLDGLRLVGVLTQKDCFRAALDASYYQQWTGVVADVMTSPPVALNSGLDIVEAAQCFLDQPYRSYPVLDGASFSGMLERGDVLRALVARG